VLAARTMSINIKRIKRRSKVSPSVVSTRGFRIR